MNYAISKYNASDEGTEYPCLMHYESTTVGYAHLYPVLKAGTPVVEDNWNPLIQKN